MGVQCWVGRTKNHTCSIELGLCCDHDHHCQHVSCIMHHYHHHIVSSHVLNNKTQACKEMAWKQITEYKAFVHGLTAGILSTQIREDCLNFMKNSKQLKGKKKYTRVQKCMASALVAKVLSKRHKYRELNVDENATLGKSKPPVDAFSPHKDMTSIEFHKLVSTSQATDWYSPGSENWQVRIADMACLRVARARREWSILARVWMGTFCRPRHHIAWKKDRSESWSFPVLNFKDSAVMMVPIVFERVVHMGKSYLTWYPSGALPSIKPVDDLDCYQAMYFA